MGYGYPVFIRGPTARVEIRRHREKDILAIYVSIIYMAPYVPVMFLMRANSLQGPLEGLTFMAQPFQWPE